MTNKSNWPIYALMYLNFGIFSFSMVLAKWAGGHDLLSFHALALYGLSFFALGIYAIVWQQVLRRLPLNKAYPAKGITIPMGMVFGYTLFGERVSINMLLGVLLVIVGIFFVVYNNE